LIANLKQEQDLIMCVSDEMLRWKWSSHQFWIGIINFAAINASLKLCVIY
jgi:hypothetical protein